MIVGTGPIALETADAYVHDSHLGYDVIAFIDPDAPASSWRELAIGARQPPVQPLDPQSRMLPAREELTEKLSLSLSLSLSHGDLDIISPMRDLPINNARPSWTSSSATATANATISRCAPASPGSGRSAPQRSRLRGTGQSRHVARPQLTLWYDIFILFETAVTVPAKAGAY